MLADLSIAWVFWFVIRWPLLDRQVRVAAVRISSSVAHAPRDLRDAFLAMQVESDLAGQQALREAGLAD